METAEMLEQMSVGGGESWPCRASWEKYREGSEQIPFLWLLLSAIPQLRRVPPTTAAKALAQLPRTEKRKRREPYSQREWSQLGMPR